MSNAAQQLRRCRQAVRINIRTWVVLSMSGVQVVIDHPLPRPLCKAFSRVTGRDTSKIESLNCVSPECKRAQGIRDTNYPVLGRVGAVKCCPYGGMVRHVICRCQDIK